MKLDHIAVAGATLEQAVQMVESTLGVQMVPGGRHDAFGTHNRLLGLADGLYIEAIAIDPAAPAPDRPRWFDLDNFQGPARLTNWICATDDLQHTLAQLPDGTGHAVQLSRGHLRWQMAVPDGGALPFDNLFPALISWQGAKHPAAMLPESGCRLQRLVVSHPQARALRAALQPVLQDTRVVIEPGPVGISAEIVTPGGVRVLR